MRLAQYLRAKATHALGKRAPLAPTIAKAIDETGKQLAKESGAAAPADKSLMPNPEGFFANVRGYTGKLSQQQVDSINAILKAGSHWPLGWMAYALATAWHESRLLPIREKGGNKYLSKYDTGRLARILGNTPEADGDGILYAGRGFVQLTGRTNYGNAGAELGLDLLNYPDLALDIPTAARILVWGMEGGEFTGRKLSHYIIGNGNHDAFVRARRIINGTDRAELIADHADRFADALMEGGWSS